MDTNAVVSMASSWPEKAKSVSIDSVERYSSAGEMLVSIKTLRNEIKEVFDPIVQKAHSAHKEALAQKAKADKPLDEAENIIKRAMSSWTQEQEAKRREEERRLREEARKAEEDRLLRQAELAAEEGDTELAYQILDSPIPNVSVIAPSNVPKIGGVSYTNRWTFRIIQPSIIPREYLIPDEKKIGGVVRAMRSGTKIPGVEVFCEKVASVRV